MTMTSFEPTSRCAIRPSGDTFDLVRPGMSRVVGRLRTLPELPESCRIGGLCASRRQVSISVKDMKRDRTVGR